MRLINTGEKAAQCFFVFPLYSDHRRPALIIKHLVHIKVFVEEFFVIGHRIAAHLDTRHERVVVVQLVDDLMADGAVYIEPRQYMLEAGTLPGIRRGDKIRVRPM